MFPAPVSWKHVFFFFFRPCMAGSSRSYPGCFGGISSVYFLPKIYRENVSVIIILITFIVRMHTHSCLSVKVRAQFTRASSLPTAWISGTELGHQAWQQTPAEPSYWPQHYAVSRTGSFVRGIRNRPAAVFVLFLSEKQPVQSTSDSEQLSFPAAVGRIFCFTF